MDICLRPPKKLRVRCFSGSWYNSLICPCFEQIAVINIFYGFKISWHVKLPRIPWFSCPVLDSYNYKETAWCDRFARCLIYFFFFFLFSFERLGLRISQTAIESRTIPTDLQPGKRGRHKFIFFPQNCPSIFTISRYSSGTTENCSNNSRIVYESWSTYTRSTKKCAAWMEVVAQLSLHFSVENMCRLKRRKKRWPSPTPFNRFSSDFNQNYHTLFGHLTLLTDNIENLGQGQNLQKGTFLKRKYFLANFQHQISLTVIGSHKSASEFGSTTANDDRLCFPTFCSIFHIFQVELKTKGKQISEISTFFKFWWGYSSSTKKCPLQ